MKILIILIYATFFLYANISFPHEDKETIIPKEYLTGSFKNLIVHKVPKDLPEIKLIGEAEASEVVLLKGDEVTVINFWATWCAPCREEMPSLNELVKSISRDNFSVIVVATGRNSEKSINEFFSKYELSNLRNFRDPLGKFSSSLSILGLPTTIIVDQHSNEIARLIGGADWNSQQAIQLLRHILESHD